MFFELFKLDKKKSNSDFLSSFNSFVLFFFWMSKRVGGKKDGTGRNFPADIVNVFQNFFANLVNVFHTKNFFTHIVYVFKIWNLSSDLVNVLWNVMNNCELLPRTTAWRAFSWLFSGTFSPKVRWAGILIRNSLPFIWKFSPCRAAQRKFW